MIARSLRLVGKHGLRDYGDFVIGIDLFSISDDHPDHALEVLATIARSRAICYKVISITLVSISPFRVLEHLVNPFGIPPVIHLLLESLRAEIMNAVNRSSGFQINHVRVHDDLPP